MDIMDMQFNHHHWWHVCFYVIAVGSYQSSCCRVFGKLNFFTLLQFWKWFYLRNCMIINISLHNIYRIYHLQQCTFASRCIMTILSSFLWWIAWCCNDSWYHLCNVYWCIHRFELWKDTFLNPNFWMILSRYHPSGLMCRHSWWCSKLMDLVMSYIPQWQPSETYQWYAPLGIDFIEQFLITHQYNNNPISTSK